MTWSQTQEDDGLDPIPGPISHVQPSSPYSEGGLPHDTTGPSTPFQSSRPPASAGPKRAQEPTLILRERQVDSIRAQVQRRRRSALLRRHVGTLLWVAAGGFAVLLGAFLARGVRALWQPDEVGVESVTEASLLAREFPSPAPQELTTPPELESSKKAAPSSSRSAPSSAKAKGSPTQAPPTQSRSSQGPSAQGPRKAALRLDEIPTE
jgi:hypothetical protein